MSKSTETPDQKAAVAAVHAGTDICLQLESMFAFCLKNVPDESDRIRFWLGFTSGLAGFIAANTSIKDAEFVMSAAASAARSLSEPGGNQQLH